MIRTRSFFFIFVVSLLSVYGCSSTSVGESSFSSKGTVKYIDLEGGFYGIYAHDGKKYDPINLPREFWREGTKVKFRYKPCTDCASFRMWGSLVDIISIQEVHTLIEEYEPI